MWKILVATLLIIPFQAQASKLKSFNALKAPFSLPALPYPADSLGKAIDTETMNIHHGKHHQAYVDNLNKAIGEEKGDLLSLFKAMSKQSTAVRNNGGGHWNHSFFWTLLSGKESDNKIPSRLEKELIKKFASVEEFKTQFEKAGLSQFGSGWAWLIRNQKGELEITTTPNQDNPLMDVATVQGWPILALDVWEHAYYLKYQNKRADYLKAVWSVVNWKQVDQYDREALALSRR